MTFCLHESARSAIYITNWLCLKNKFTTVSLYAIFCLEFFSSIFFTSYTWSLSDKAEKLEPHAKDWGQRATRGEAPWSVTAEEGHWARNTTVMGSSLLSSTVLLNKQHSNFCSIVAGKKEPFLMFLETKLRASLMELHLQLNIIF